MVGKDEERRGGWDLVGEINKEGYVWPLVLCKERKCEDMRAGHGWLRDL